MTHKSNFLTHFMILGLVLAAQTVYLQQKTPFVLIHKSRYNTKTDVTISAQTAHKLAAAWTTAQPLTLISITTPTTHAHLCLLKLKLIENNFTEKFPPRDFLRRRPFTYTVFMSLLQQATTPIEEISADSFFGKSIEPTYTKKTYTATDKPSTTGDTYITQCLFISCSDRAIYFEASAKLYVEKSTFTQCSTSSGSAGALYFCSASTSAMCVLSFVCGVSSNSGSS